MAWGYKGSQQFVGGIDQGTTSTRFMIFDTEANPVASHQIEFQQIYERPGWVEHDPFEIIESVLDCIEIATKEFLEKGFGVFDIAAVGVTNQRETTVIWNKDTGIPIYNAIVWSDTRTSHLVTKFKSLPNADEVQKKTGLPFSTYFAALKARWIIDNVPDARALYEQRKLMFGTMDTWVLYNLTGGVDGGLHYTDSTNASRTMLADIYELKYDPFLIEFFGLEKLILPEIRCSSEVFGRFSKGSLEGVRIAGILGDQSAALVGQCAFKQGAAKNTYGTGCFLLYNTGENVVISQNGLLTTVAYHFQGQKPVYALEGSIATAGSAVKWLRDQMRLIKTSEETGEEASKVKDAGGVVFVTAFSGLFAPYWYQDARGTIVGITGYTTKAHICRATLEACCFQTKAILDAMEKDSKVALERLRVDGGMTASDVCMQIQADILGIDVEKPALLETTTFGSVIAAGLAVGVWEKIEDLFIIHKSGIRKFHPQISSEQRSIMQSHWEKAVEKSKGWEQEMENGNEDEDALKVDASAD